MIQEPIIQTTLVFQEQIQMEQGCMQINLARTMTDPGGYHLQGK